jgi:hemolysin activation/secretion protein
MGINTQIETGFTQNLSNSSKNFFYLTPELSIDHKLISSGKLVLDSKVKSHLNFSSDFEYYQGASIGGDDGLRGFRNQRFTGQKSFYQSTDLRYAMGSLKNNIIPMQYGLYAGFDYGRVWVNSDTSNTWHTAQGIGFFMNIASTLASQVGLFNSIEGWRFNFTLGFDF